MSSAPRAGVRRTIDWDDATRAVVLLDRTRLPENETWLRIRRADDLCEAVANLRVDGPSALGVAGTLGVALAACRAEDAGDDVVEAATKAAAALMAARPALAHLAVGAARALARVGQGVEAVVAEARSALREDERANEAIARRGADLVRRLTGRDRGISLLTLGNAGGLSAVSWGTALGVVRALHEGGRVGRVDVCETRPRLAGSRLTAWELDCLGVEYRVLVDGAAAGLLLDRSVDAVLVGATRITAAGAVVNDVGTLVLALGAHRAGVPFVVATRDDVVDRSGAGPGAREERDGADVVPHDPARAWNPTFDVTPPDLVTAVVTEQRTWSPAPAVGEDADHQ